MVGSSETQYTLGSSITDLNMSSGFKPRFFALVTQWGEKLCQPKVKIRSSTSNLLTVYGDIQLFRNCEAFPKNTESLGKRDR